MAWSRKSAMFASLATALYLLGLVLRNSQLVTVAVVFLSFLPCPEPPYLTKPHAAPLRRQIGACTLTRSQRAHNGASRFDDAAPERRRPG